MVIVGLEFRVVDQRELVVGVDSPPNSLIAKEESEDPHYQVRQRSGQELLSLELFTLFDHDGCNVLLDVFNTRHYSRILYSSIVLNMAELKALLTHPTITKEAKSYIPESKDVGTLTLYFKQLLSGFPDDSKMDKYKPFIYERMNVVLQYEVYYGPLAAYRTEGAKLMAYELCRHMVRLPTIEKEFNFQKESVTGNRLLDRLYDRLFSQSRV